MEQVRVSAEDHIVLVCIACGDERIFEQPPCSDGHGDDCPEWACTSCGAAVLVGPAPAERPTARPRPVRETPAVRDLRGRDRAAARIPA